MTKLCPRGKAAAKRKFKVYPSAYANAYASKICAGKARDPSGVKRKDFRGPKPAGKAVGGIAVRLGKAGAKYLKSKEGREKLEKINKGPLPKKTGELLNKFKSAMTKKKDGGMTAGSMSGMGRLQKAKMMSGGFGIFSKRKDKTEKETKKSPAIVKAESHKNKKKKRLEELRKEISGMKKGGGMMKAKRGKLVPLKKDPTKPISSVKPSAGGKGSGTTNLGNPRKKGDPFLERRFKLAGAKSLIGKAGRLGIAGAALGAAGAGAAMLGRKIGKKLDEAKKKNKKMGGGMMKYREGGVTKLRDLAKRYKALPMSSRTKKMLGPKATKALKQIRSKRFLKEMPGFEKGGDAKIKKVISGLNKASALHKSQAKSLQTVVGKSVGGMADYYKDLM